MGADYEGQEKGIQEIKKLGAAGRTYLMHHLNNSLVAILYRSMKGDPEGVEEAIDHINQDMKRAGLRL